MEKQRRQGRVILALFLALAWLSAPGALNAAPAAKPAIVLTAFGTSTEAFATYDHFEKKVRERFPDYEVRWAFTSRKVRAKVEKEQGRKLNDLGTTLRELKAAGVTRTAIQSLHIVPGEEWDKKIVQVSREVPGLKVALGKPLLSSPADQERTLKAIAPLLHREPQTAVLLMAHGSPTPAGERAYLGLARHLTSRYQNVFLASVEGKPDKKAAFAAVQKANPETVVLIPFMFVAGEHAASDMLGDDPKSWKSELLKQKPYRIEGVTQGLGYLDGIGEIFLDHLAQALKELEGGK